MLSKQQTKKYLQTSQRCQVIKYSMRKAAQLVVVQPPAIYFTVVILKQLKTQKIGYGNTFRFPECPLMRRKKKGWPKT